MRKTKAMEEWASPEGLLRLAGWAREGLGEEEIARRMGVSPRVLRAWRRARREIDTALRGTREVVDRMVEEALLRRALGYCWTEERTEVKGDKENLIRVRKHVPGDVRSMLFWLRLRMPEKYGDVPAPLLAAAAYEEEVEEFVSGQEGD